MTIAGRQHYIPSSFPMLKFLFLFSFLFSLISVVSASNTQLADSQEDVPLLQQDVGEVEVPAEADEDISPEAVPAVPNANTTTSIISYPGDRLAFLYTYMHRYLWYTQQGNLPVVDANWSVEIGAPYQRDEEDERDGVWRYDVRVVNEVSGFEKIIAGERYSGLSAIGTKFAESHANKSKKDFIMPQFPIALHKSFHYNHFLQQRRMDLQQYFTKLIHYDYAFFTRPGNFPNLLGESWIVDHAAILSELAETESKVRIAQRQVRKYLGRKLRRKLVQERQQQAVLALPAEVDDQAGAEAEAIDVCPANGVRESREVKVSDSAGRQITTWFLHLAQDQFRNVAVVARHGSALFYIDAETGLPKLRDDVSFAGIIKISVLCSGELAFNFYSPFVLGKLGREVFGPFFHNKSAFMSATSFAAFKFIMPPSITGSELDIDNFLMSWYMPYGQQVFNDKVGVEMSANSGAVIARFKGIAISLWWALDGVAKLVFRGNNADEIREVGVVTRDLRQVVFEDGVYRWQTEAEMAQDNGDAVEENRLRDLEEENRVLREQNEMLQGRPDEVHA